MLSALCFHRRVPDHSIFVSFIFDFARMRVYFVFMLYTIVLTFNFVAIVFFVLTKSVVHFLAGSRSFFYFVFIILCC